jgi:hypothetical protein
VTRERDAARSARGSAGPRHARARDDRVGPLYAATRQFGVGQVRALTLVLSVVQAFAARRRARPRWQHEEDVFGMDHGDVGGLLLGSWGLPAAVDAVAEQAQGVLV